MFAVGRRTAGAALAASLILVAVDSGGAGMPSAIGQTAPATGDATASASVPFEPEVGQGVPGDRFVAHFGGAVARFRPDGVDLVLSGQTPVNNEVTAPSGTARLRFVGTDSGVSVVPGAALPGRVSYLI